MNKTVNNLKKTHYDVSCIMSVYKNDEEFWVRDAIFSILNGDELPGEFLVYFDGPVKPSIRLFLHEILREYGDIVFLFERENNRGRAYSRQFMVERAKGKYILLMDADDISVAERLKLQYDYAIANPGVDMIGGYIAEFSNNFDNRLRKVPLSNCEIRSVMKYAQPINHVTLLVKKNLIMSVGGYLEAGNCEDFNLIARCIVSGAIAENLPEVLVQVRVDDNFVIRRRGWRIALDELRVIKYLWRSKYIGMFEFFVYGFYRIIIRIFPAWLIIKLYSLSRSNVRV